jgi:hypothetical protein
MFRWPQVVAVTDLDSALRAVGEIIEQGEGARGHWEDAHYGRFLGIWDEYRALRRSMRSRAALASATGARSAPEPKSKRRLSAAR